MQIRKTYRDTNPELVYDELRDFVVKRGAKVSDHRIETYSQATDSSSFVTRGNITFTVLDPASNKDRECCRAHLIGSARSETKLIIDVDEKLFSSDKIAALQEDMDFIFGSHEIRAG